MRSGGAALGGLFLVALAASLAGCGGSEEAAPEVGVQKARKTPMAPTTSEATEPAQSAPRRELDCEREGYPCAWSEVAPEVAKRTDELARSSVARLDDGASAGEIAVGLAELPEVASVATDGTLVRFRLEGGRPVWVAEARPEVFDLRSFATPAHAQQPGQPGSGPDDPIGKNPPGKKPWKKALILAPFQWHFGDTEVEDLQKHLGVSKSADQDPFAVRDYRCDGDQRCVEVKANDLIALDPEKECWETPGQCPMSYGVERSDFKTWGNYDLIHVGTHGFYLCGTANPDEVVQWITSWESATGNRSLAGTSAKLVAGGCVVALATGRIYPDGSVAVGSVTDPGVEYFYAGLGQYCAGAPQGSIRWIQQYCHTDVFLLEVVADDFFSSVYGGGLKDKLIFLNACSGLADRGIAQALASGDSVILGWSDPVPMGVATKAADVFYEAYLDRDLPADDAWWEAASQVSANVPVGLEIDQGWRTSIPEGIVPEPTELESAGSKGRRGREMVSLRWPGSDEEIEDGARLPAAPSDGETCSPRLGLMLEGVPEGASPGEIPLRLSVDGATLEPVFHAVQAAGPHRFRYDGPVEMPASDDPERPVDLEIWAELPAGGQSRWLYEDVKVRCGCSFDATVAGHSGRGRVQGIWANFSTRGSGGMMGMFMGPTAESKEDLLNAFKMVQAPGGGANPMLDALSKKWGQEIADEKAARGPGGGTLNLSLIEVKEGQAGPGGSGIAGAFKLDAFSSRALEPGFQGAVPLEKLAVHTGEFAELGLAPMLFLWDPSKEGSAQLTIDSYD
ncbi:MAG: hypothetical protein KDB94_04110, partial [Acidobacteria bacterium]|nr:hypothetical protein [Acidobacteriota bacterium]